ncbi:MAG: hypothetical protein GYB67_12460, partial [Chloroflexi bacterium]|nr:hypothetical protein [Chloroflexota bacterium]
PLFEVSDPDGGQIDANANPDADLRDIRLEITLPADGEYTITIAASESSPLTVGGYELILQVG